MGIFNAERVCFITFSVRQWHFCWSCKSSENGPLVCSIIGSAAGELGNWEQNPHHGLGKVILQWGSQKSDFIIHFTNKVAKMRKC